MQCTLKPIDCLLLGKSVEASTVNEHCITKTCKHRSRTNLTGVVTIGARKLFGQVSPNRSSCWGQPCPGRGVENLTFRFLTVVAKKAMSLNLSRASKSRRVDGCGTVAPVQRVTFVFFTHRSFDE